MKEIKIKLLDTETEKKQFYKLRHKVFTDELKWVDSEEFEIDRFDEGAEFIGVFFRNNLVTATRIINSNLPWMFDDVFNYLLKEPINKDAQSIETTRYFVDKKYRRLQKIDGYKFFFSKILQHGVFHYCILKGYNKLYCTLAKMVYTLFKMQGIPVINLNEDIKLAADDAELPALIDLKALNINLHICDNYSEIADFCLLAN